MNWPKSIPIMGKNIPIIYKNMGTRVMGCYQDMAITLNTNRKAHWNKRVLFHEVLHAVLAISGITNLLSTNTEEAIVECLENNLWPLIKFLV